MGGYIIIVLSSGPPAAPAASGLTAIWLSLMFSCYVGGINLGGGGGDGGGKSLAQHFFKKHLAEKHAEDGRSRVDRRERQRGCNTHTHAHTH